MQIKHNLLNKNTTANRVSSRGNPVNLSLQPSLHLCKAPFGDRTNKNSIVNRGSPICVRKRNPADCHHLFVWFCLWDSKFVFIIWFSRGSFGQPCYKPTTYWESPIYGNPHITVWFHRSQIYKGPNYTRMSVYILWMEEILHHRGWLKHVETL